MTRAGRNAKSAVAGTTVLLLGLLVLALTSAGGGDQFMTTSATASVPQPARAGVRLSDSAPWRVLSDPLRLDSLLAAASDAAREIERAGVLDRYAESRMLEGVDLQLRGAVDRARSDRDEVQRRSAQAQEAIEQMLNDSNPSPWASLVGFTASFLGSLAGVDAVLNAGIATGLRTGVETGSWEQGVFALGIGVGATYVSQEVGGLFRGPGTDAGPSPSFLQDLISRRPANEVLSDLGANAAYQIVTETGNQIAQRFTTTVPGEFDIPRIAKGALADYASSAYASGVPRDVGAPAHAASTFRTVAPGREAVLAAQERGEEGHATNRGRIFTPDLVVSASFAGKDAVAVLRRDLLERDEVAIRQIRRVVQGRQAVLGITMAALAADIETHEKLLEEYHRVRELKENQGGGLFGSIVKLVVGAVGTLGGGPVLGAALSGALGAALYTDDTAEILAAAGFAAGVKVGQIGVSHAVEELLDRAEDDPLLLADTMAASDHTAALVPSTRNAPTPPPAPLRPTPPAAATTALPPPATLGGGTAPASSPSPAAATARPTQGVSIEQNDRLHRRPFRADVSTRDLEWSDELRQEFVIDTSQELGKELVLSAIPGVGAVKWTGKAVTWAARSPRARKWILKFVCAANLVVTTEQLVTGEDRNVRMPSQLVTDGRRRDKAERLRDARLREKGKRTTRCR